MMLKSINIWATVAQMVEQFTRNDQVSGSIPLGGSIIFQYITDYFHLDEYVGSD